MRAVTKLLGVQAKRTLRDPAAVFFMVAFGPVFALVMGTIFGNDPVPEFGGRGYVDANLVSFTAIVVAITGFVLVPIDTVSQRETGALRRFRATPLSPLSYITADVLVRFMITLLSVALMLAVGIVGFGARPEGSIVAVLAAAALGVAVFLAVGYALAALLPSQGAAQMAGNILVYPLIILSGAAVPLAVLPDGAREVGRFSPLTRLVELLQGAWRGQAFAENWVPLVVLLGTLAAATAVAAAWFRWE